MGVFYAPSYYCGAQDELELELEMEKEGKAKARVKRKRRLKEDKGGRRQLLEVPGMGAGRPLANMCSPEEEE